MGPVDEEVSPPSPVDIYTDLSEESRKRVRRTPAKTQIVARSGLLSQCIRWCPFGISENPVFCLELRLLNFKRTFASAASGRLVSLQIQVFAFPGR